MAKKKSPDRSADDQTADAHEKLHPRFTNRSFGLTEAEGLFLRSFQGGSLHHAWLLTGEKGIGKATFAYGIARFLLSRQDGGAASSEPQTLAVPASHPVSRQVAAGAHPSLFVLGEASRTAGATASIGVDAVRRLRAFMNLTSPAGWRVMIVDPANDLTIASANALLKAIEEPPPRTVFFLISHGAAAVMPTIRSRCVRLGFRPLQPLDFEAAVRQACEAAQLAVPAADELTKLYDVACGSPGDAINLITADLVPLADQVAKLIANAPSIDYVLAHKVIQTAVSAKNSETFRRLCELIERLVELKARSEALEQQRGMNRSAGWAQLWQRLRERRINLETLNLDKGAFLLTAFSDMENMARNRS